MTERVFKPRFKAPAGAVINPWEIKQRGMRFWKNRGNGFAVAVCHYTADPEKRSEEWYAEATKDLKPHQRDREYEINFESRAGKKAFGYLLEQPNRWLVPNMNLKTIPKHWRIIASLDYGTQNPTAIYFFAIDPLRRFHAVYEFYKPSNVRDIAAVLKGEYQGPNLEGNFTDYRHPLWSRCEKVVVDGAIFKKDQDQGDEGHKSIGDLIEEQGIYIMERATKDRIAGLARVEDMLNPAPDDPEVKPNLVFCQRCKHAWKEFTELVFEETPPHLLLNKNHKEDIVAKNDHCFVAGTLVSTPRGGVPIEEIRKGELVLTRSGFRPVLDGGPTEVAQTYTLKFDNGCQITCTANHPIWTENRGFVRADELRYDDICVTNKKSKWKPLFLTKSLFGAIQTQSRQTIENISSAARNISKAAFGIFTVKFGNPITAQSQMASMFTTRMAIPSIMTSLISNAFPRKSITKITTKTTSHQPILSTEKRYGLRIGSKQGNGTPPTRAANGTESTQKRHSIFPKLQSLLAQSVEVNFLPPNLLPDEQISAPISVAPPRDAHPASMTLRLLADFAGRCFGKTNTLKQRRAAVYVAHLCERRQAEIAQVYNLSVEGFHEYFAEGILVHNSYDSVRYALMSIQAPSNEPPEPKPGEGTFGAVEKQMDLDDDEESGKKVDFF